MTAAVCAVSLGSTSLVYLAWTRSQHNPGMTQDADFWTLLQSSIMQLLSLFTMIYPVWRRSWMPWGTWTWTWGIRSCQSFVHRRSTTPVYRRPRPVELSSVIRRQRCSSACGFAIDASRRGRQRSWYSASEATRKTIIIFVSCPWSGDRR